ncbi:MAG: deoxyribodipyrimidine photolyase [Acidobacteriota bacterium]
MVTCPSKIPEARLLERNEAPVRASGSYVLYWMIAARRAAWNFGLQRAVEWASELGRPLVVLEALRCDYRWASDRLHAFVIEGMGANARSLSRTPVHYYPYIEPRSGQGKGLLEAWARDASVIVTDDFPCFFLPRMVDAAARRLPVRLEAVDSNGLLPMRATSRVFLRAVDYRRYMQKTLPEHLDRFPSADPLQGVELPRLDELPSEIVTRWPMARIETMHSAASLADLPIDHSVPRGDAVGGSEAARAALQRFLDHRLGRYADGRLDVRERATSELSPYLHFGHLAAHEVFDAVVRREEWNAGRLFHKATASRSGWWGMSPAAEGFLDQLATWRELGYNMCALRDDFASYDSLPAWARETLAAHADDPRPFVYTLEQFETAATHDELWNAAQRELVQDGRIHNYLRMLWAKKILEWSETPRDALAVMIELNNKYAVDGRNPNSYSGIFWCLGRYDRAWGPERPIFGKVRYMSSDSTRRKLDAKAYVAAFSAQQTMF